MKYVLFALTLATLACGKDSPLAPSIPPADLMAQGTLTVQTCSASSATLFTCFSYAGTMKNTGTGCAINVRGLTKTFLAGTQTQVGSSEWTYAAKVRPNEEFGYTGFNLVVPGPLTGGWIYTTVANWDPIAC